VAEDDIVNDEDLMKHLRLQAFLCAPYKPLIDEVKTMSGSMVIGMCSGIGYYKRYARKCLIEGEGGRERENAGERIREKIEEVAERKAKRGVISKLKEVKTSQI
jgi:hypothetical protein